MRGVVYYAAYLKHLEEGRTEYCLSKGINLSEYALKGIIFPVVHLEIDYKAPARYADTVQIFTQVEKIGNSSIHFVQEIKRNGAVLIKAKTVWACIEGEFKTHSVPEEIKNVLLQ